MSDMWNIFVIYILAIFVSGGYSNRYLGCYKDLSTTARLLSGTKQNFKGNLTNKVCIDYCQSKGFRYAGTEWRLECFCGNDRPSYHLLADEEECNLKCEGDDNQICGGNSRINVYDVEGSNQNAVATHYVGCFEDDESRIFKGARKDSEIQTAEYCVGYCYRRGFRLAGLQYSKECFCDDSINQQLKTGNDQCDYQCSGDSNQKCGGNWRLTVYHTGIPDVPNDDNYVGCYKDDASSVRILSGVRLVFKDTNSQRRCRNVCLAAGYKYSGNEYGYECFCGNRKPSSDLEVEENQCHMPCPGNKNEYCGGGWRILVFTTGSGNIKPVIPELTTTRRPVVITEAPITRPPTKPPVTSVITPKPQRSETTINGKHAVKGQLIFKEEFNSNKIDNQKWSHSIFMPWTPDYDFVTFVDKQQNSFIRNGKLFIKPTLLDDLHVRKGRINLQNCTGQQYSEECVRQAATFSILPPVESARIHTKESFAFRFGTVQIVAKLPIGDWIIPEIWLEPKRKEYGISYASGRIRIAMARGNENLVLGNQDIGNNQLESGILMGVGENIRGRTVVRERQTGWHDQFHNFTFIWTPDNLAFTVDGDDEQELLPAQGGSMCKLAGFTEDDCHTWRTGSSIAPFDGEFYISLGLSVGGMRDFPDESYSGNVKKPWKNKSVKAMAYFWQGRDNWVNTWIDDSSALQVESVKVIAL